MKKPYSYVVVQYVPDSGAGEALNIGVIVYSRAEGFLRLKVDTHYERLSQAFAGFDGNAFRRAVVNLRQVFTEGQHKLSHAPLFEGDREFSDWLRLLLPDIGASITVTSARHGITADPDRETVILFERMVESQKAQADERPRRDDSDVWRRCERHLSPDVVAQLQPKEFVTTSVRMKFEHAVKNGRWHAIQPLSMDFKRPESMQRKASQWVGTTIGLQDAPEFGSITFVVGRPTSGPPAALDRALRLLAHVREIGVVIDEEDAERLNERIRTLLADTTH